MKKLIAIVVLLAVVLIVALPGVIGALTFDKFQATARQLHQSRGKVVLDTEIERGWFSTRYTFFEPIMDPESIEMAVDYLDFTSTDELPNIETQILYTHGPLPITTPANGGLLPALGVATLEWFIAIGEERKRVPARGLMRAGITKVHVDFDFEAFTMETRNATKIDYSGGSLVATSPLRERVFSGGGNLGALTINGSERRLQFDDFPVEFLLPVPDGNIGSSTISAKISVMDFHDQTDPDADIVIRDLSLTSSGTNTNDRFVSSLRVTIGELELVGKRVSDFGMQLRGELDSSNLLEMQALSTSPDPDNLEIQARLAELGIDTFSKGASLDLKDLRFTMPQGTLLSYLEVELPAGVNDPALMRDSVEGVGRLELPSTLMDELVADLPNGRGMLEYGLSSGMLKRSEGSLISDIKIVDGVVSVNGVPIPLSF